MNRENITIRKVKISDLENLTKFFIKAYGKDTVFQNEDFLNYYFAAEHHGRERFTSNLVGVLDHGEIVAHYGGLDYNLNIGGNKYNLIWGVNAYTLPEYRGLGINSEIVKYIKNNSEINGVIGFSPR